MTDQQSPQQRIDELLARRHNLAVEAYGETDNAVWSSKWDECASLATEAAEIAAQAGDAEQAESLRKMASDNTHKADVFRDRPNAEPAGHQS